MKKYQHKKISYEYMASYELNFQVYYFSQHSCISILFAYHYPSPTYFCVLLESNTRLHIKFLCVCPMQVCHQPHMATAAGRVNML